MVAPQVYRPVLFETVLDCDYSNTVLHRGVTVHFDRDEVRLQVSQIGNSQL